MKPRSRSRSSGIAFAAAAVVAAVVVAAAADDAQAQSTTRVSVDSSGNQVAGGCALASLSADGRFVAFQSLSATLVPGDTNGLYDLFVHDRRTGTTERISVDSGGLESDGNSYAPSISADGRYVVFGSNATNLVANDVNGNVNDVFLRDRTTGTTELVSLDTFGVHGDLDSGPAVISADGRYVAFESFATNLVGLDTNHTVDVFVRDLSTGVTERVSVDGSGFEGDGPSRIGAISANGQIVVFQSDATNLALIDANGTTDVFAYDRGIGALTCLSVDSGGAAAKGRSYDPAISADGAFVAFASEAANLVAGDANATVDAFVHDRASGVIELVSVNSAGVQAAGYSERPALSADGRFIAFSSVAANLAPHDTNANVDVFVRDRSRSTTKRMSVDSAGVGGNFLSTDAAISANGQFVAFGSYASNLVAGDTNGSTDLFVHERPGYASWTNYGAGFPGTLGVPDFTSRNDPFLGAAVTLDLGNSSGAATFALLFVGAARATIHSSFGGELLVAPMVVIGVALPAGGTTFSGAIPSDPNLIGVAVDAQVLEADPGAAKGVSFTAGLELVLGN